MEEDDIPTFAKRVKEKYPEYAEVDDVELVERMVRKYPVYANKVKLPKDFRLLRASSGYPKIDDLYERYGREYGVDPNLLLEQGRQETGFNPDHFYGRTKSRNAQGKEIGARGSGQFMEGTAKRFKVDVTNPEDGVRGQAEYMRTLLDQFDGNEELALAGYNAGENRQSLRNGKIPNIKETQDYVKIITNNVKNLRSGDLTLHKFFSQPPTKSFVRPGEKVPSVMPPTPTNPTQVPLKTGATEVPAQAGVEVFKTPESSMTLEPGMTEYGEVSRPALREESPALAKAKARLDKRKAQGAPVTQATPKYVTGEPVVSDTEYDEQGNVIKPPPPSTNLRPETFTRDTADAAVAEKIVIPDTVKTRDEARRYITDQLKAKYPNVTIPDRFTFLSDWKPGHGAVIDYGTLKQMGVDTDALISEKIAQERVNREEAPVLKVPVASEAEAEKAIDQRVRSADYSGQQRMAEFLADPTNLILPVAVWNLTRQKTGDVTDEWVASQKKRLIDQYGSYGKALQAEEYYKNSDWAETVTRMARQTAGSFAKNLFSGTAKSIASLGQLAEDISPVNWILPDKAKIGVRNLVNGADFLTRLMTAPSAGDAVREMEWASGDDISKQQLFRAAKEFDKAIGDDPVLKGRFLGSLSDAGGSALAFVALGAMMPAMRTTNFWGKTRDWSSAISGALQGAGTGYEEGKTQGLSEADARKFGIIQGLLGTTEMVGAGAELTAFLKDPTLRRQIASALLEVGKGIKREAKQEFAQEVFQTTSGRVVLEYLKDSDPSTLNKLSRALNKLPLQLAEAVTNEGVIAAITGGLMGGAGTAASIQADPEVKREGQTEYAPTLPEEQEAPPATLEEVQTRRKEELHDFYQKSAVVPLDVDAKVAPRLSGLTIEVPRVKADGTPTKPRKVDAAKYHQELQTKQQTLRDLIDCIHG